MQKFSESITEKETLEVGQIWQQKVSNHDNATSAQLQKREEEIQDKKSKAQPYSKAKDIIEIISFLGKDSVDVKSSEKNKIVTLDRKYILKNFNIK